MLNLQKLFCIYRNYNILQFFNVVYHIEYFVYIEDSMHPGINSIWFGYKNLLIWCWYCWAIRCQFVFFFLTVFLSLIDFYSHNFMVQLSYPYMTTGKAIALTIWTFSGKVMSLLLNMLSKLVINFLPRSKSLLISWLQSQSAVILEPKK